MSHVDEGALHAYLDGALDEYPAADARRIREHLDACGACAERLEVERSLRADAHAMLGMAAPNVDLPSFEELRAYVERTRPAPSRVSVRITRLSWAASVMLALGVGWTLRGGRLEPVADVGLQAPATVEASRVAGETLGESRAVETAGFADASLEADRATGAREVGTIEPEAFATRADLPNTTVAKSAGDEAGETMPTGATAAEAQARVQEEVAEASASRAELGASATTLDAIVAEAEPLGARDAAAPPAEPAPSRPALDQDVVAGAAASNVAADVVDVTSEDRAAETEALAAAEPADVDEATPERRRSDSPTALTSQFSSGRGGVRVVPQDDDRFGDEPFPSVPGFEVLSLENIGDGTVFLGTVATQRLEGEDLMQVFVLEPEVELDVLPPLEPMLNEVRIAAETGWVVVRGPRSEDELEVLLMRLFPE